MSTETYSEEIVQKPKVRLRFIDMARSVAILLMLEGHFVDDSLADIYRDPENGIYATWVFIRGFTAPVFLTVTGLIFVYLLLKNRQEGFFENLRVRKGYKRVIELLFWGFVVQYYAFHVLECIALGIFTILAIFGIYKLIRFVPLWLLFFLAGISLFGFNLYLETLPLEAGWPENAPGFIQNMFHGKSSRAIFPIVPWMGYTMFGAMIGALLHDFHDHVKKFRFIGTVMAIGALLFFFPKEILGGMNEFVHWIRPSFSYDLVKMDWLYERMGMVLMELGALILIDKFVGDRMRGDNLFLKIGQNTLTIYIIHMFILYGSVSGFGLNSLINKQRGMFELTPWQVAIGAVVFVTFFVFLIKYLDQIKAKLEFILGPIRRFFNRLFAIR